VLGKAGRERETPEQRKHISIWDSLHGRGRGGEGICTSEGGIALLSCPS
jgi:hypothetical protein